MFDGNKIGGADKLSASPAILQSGFLDALNPGAQLAQLRVHLFVTAVQVVDAVDFGGPLGGQAGAATRAQLVLARVALARQATDPALAAAVRTGVSCRVGEQAAPTRPVSCERAPAASATGVREALLLTEKPWKKPAATLAAPRATSS